MLQINTEKCVKDDVCIAVCPMLIILKDEETGYPKFAEYGADACFKCGHCVAACSQGAISHEDVSLEECRVIEKDLAISAAQADQFLSSRRSVRAFKNKPVAREQIAAAIQIASMGPNSRNIQLLKWLVFNDREQINQFVSMIIEWARKIADGSTPNESPYPLDKLQQMVAIWDLKGTDVILRNCPGLVIALVPAEMGNGLVDPAIGLTYFELAATSQGFGTCLAGAFYHALQGSEELRKAVGITEEYPFFYPMMFGYPKYKMFRIPKRKAPQIVWR